MSWRDCIATALETGRISAKKADEAFAAYDEAYERALAEGAAEGEAVARAADEALEEITTLKAAKRWQRINEMQRSHELYNRLASAKNIEREVHEIAVDLELSHDTIMGFALSNLDRLLEEYRPRLAGLKLPEAGMDDVARAAFGDVRSPEAKEMAEAIQETMETLRQWANQYGAAIPENPNRHLFQTHDAVKVSSVERDVWVNDHLRDGVLDWEVMRYGGKKIPVEKRREVLENTYDAIRSDGYNKPETAQGNEASLATRLNRDRFLYYKDGEAWLDMQRKYGSGNLYEQTIGMIDAMAKDIALLRVFGPSAHSTKEFMKRQALHFADAADAAKGANQRKTLNNVRRRLEVFDDEYEIFSRHTPSVEGNFAVQAFTTTRTMAVNALLGGVFIPSLFGDMANAKAARHLLNMPTNDAFQRYFRDFVPSKAKRQEVIDSGIIFHNGISLAHSRVRYFGLMDGPHWARRIGEFTYRFGLASHHTQVARNAAGKDFMAILARHSDVEFDDLPFAPFLIERGITADDWSRLRAMAPKDVEGAKFLRPIDLWRAGDAKDKEAAERFGNAMQMYIRTWVPDTSLRSRAAMGEAVDPNTVKGQALRTMTSLISFPVAVYFNQLRRIAMAEGVGNKLRLAAAYFTWMTLGGMFITQTKALLNGQNPYEMLPRDERGNWDFSDPRWLDFWGRSIVNGGSLGILGDTIFNNINISNTGYRPGNPTEEYYKALHKLTVDNAIDYARGDELNVSTDALRFLDKNVPNFWQSKLIMERYIYDDMFRQADPAGYARMKSYEQEHEEGMWWGRDQEPQAPTLVQ